MPIPHKLEEAQRQLRAFESTKQTVSEMLNLCLIDSSQVVNKIRSQVTDFFCFSTLKIWMLI